MFLSLKWWPLMSKMSFVYSACIGHDFSTSPTGGVPIEAGVNTVLGRATNRLDQRQREPNRSEWVKLRIASNDKGIAHVIDDLSNLLQMGSKSLGRARLVLVVS